MLIYQFLWRLKKVFEAGIVQVLIWAGLLNIGFGVAFYYAERGAIDGLTLADSLWWSMVTMTTVGYGDFYAQTFVGRFLISYPCMLLGIGIIGYLVGVVANNLLDWASRKRKGLLKIKHEGHIIICSFPGEDKIMDIVRELRAVPKYKGCPIVLVTDQLEELPQKLSKEGLLFVQGKTTDEDVLLRAGIKRCMGVLVLAEDPHEDRSDDRTYTTGSLIELISRQFDTPIHTVAELVASRSLRTLERAQVDGVVSADGVASRLLVQEFQHPGVTKVIGQMMTHTTGSQLYLQETNSVGKPIIELQKAVLEHEANLQIIGVIQGDDYILNPDKQLILGQGDKLIILADDEQDLARIEADIA